VPVERRPAAPRGPERRRGRRPSLGRARALDRGVPGQPLIHDTGGAEGISRAFTSIAARLPDDRQSLQLIAQRRPLPVEAILAAEREDCHSAADDARSRSSQQLAVAVERLGLATGTVDPRSEPGACGARAALLRGRALAARAGGNRSAALAAPSRAGDARAAEYERGARESARHTEGVRADLESIGLAAHLLSGAEVATMIWARFARAKRTRPALICVWTCPARSISSADQSVRGPTRSNCDAPSARRRST